MSKGKGSNYRSAKTGQFVTRQQAQRRPATTLEEARGGGSTDRYRSAKTGQFVTEREAKLHPSTTVKES